MLAPANASNEARQHFGQLKDVEPSLLSVTPDKSELQ